MDKETISFRLDSAKKAALDALAIQADRDRSYLLNKAVEAYIDLHSWQLKEIQKAVKEADRGDFASEEGMAALLKKYKP